jgi:hypothetical protein
VCIEFILSININPPYPPLIFLLVKQLAYTTLISSELQHYLTLQNPNLNICASSQHLPAYLLELNTLSKSRSFVCIFCVVEDFFIRPHVRGELDLKSSLLKKSSRRCVDSASWLDVSFFSSSCSCDLQEKTLVSNGYEGRWLEGYTQTQTHLLIL